ncbi:MAG: hypothetical protein IT307_00915 [Chloroflexi bacterium]|nr:hypothetical protein [Chloroflexota bacterium]
MQTPPRLLLLRLLSYAAITAVLVAGTLGSGLLSPGRPASVTRALAASSLDAGWPRLTGQPGPYVADLSGRETTTTSTTSTTPSTTTSSTTTTRTSTTSSSTDTGAGDNSGTGGNGNNNSNSNNNFNANDNFEITRDRSPITIPTLTPPPPGTVTTCAQPGHDTTLTSSDGRVSLYAPPTLGSPAQLSIRTDVPLSLANPTSGIRVGGLLFQVAVQGCDGSPVATLPPGVDLTVRYSPLDVAALSVSQLLLAWLDPATGLWVTASNLVGDPQNNALSAPITQPGLYTVYQP